jgi:hypothetical protein
MTERILGEAGPKRRRRFRFVFLPILLTSALALLLAGGAQAVHDDGIFQLDRNAVTADPGNPATTGEDWDKVCSSGTPAGAASCLGGTAADASFWTVDAVNNKGNDTTLYTGGSTKDDLNINGGPGSGWLFTSGGGPDKDDLSDAYAARYSDHLYFGTDRFSASGDSVVGIWFLQANVAPITGGAKRGHFSGAHVNGDVLVLADFTQGGATVTARVFKWHNPGGAIDNTLDLIQGQLGTPADCVGPPQVPNNDNACATVNNENENSPWAFSAKESGSAPGIFPAGHFFEGGIDLAGLNLANECFSSVIIESRASQSTDSVLKDFAAHTFQHCSATMDTTPTLADGTPTNSVNPGTAVHDVANVFGSNPSKDPSSPPNVNFFLCSFAVGSTDVCDGTTNAGVAAGSVALTGNGDGSSAASSPAVNTAANPLQPGHYCFRAEWDGDANYVGKLTHDGANECFDVSTIETAISTAQPAFYPNDSATVSTADGSNLPAGGNVKFSLYNSLADCNGGGTTGRLYGPEQQSITGGTLTQTVNTHNTTVALNSADTAYWRVVYTTGSAAYTNRESKCIESVNHSTTDDAGPGTIP